MEYLGHKLTQNGVEKGCKVDAVKNMPEPTDVSSLRSFMGSVQFYGKLIPNLYTITALLIQLSKKNTSWNWNKKEKDAFDNMKTIRSNDTVLAHFNPSQQIGISCDALASGIGAVLFQRCEDGSECPISNVSKTLTDAQSRYSQIQKEALQ